MAPASWHHHRGVRETSILYKMVESFFRRNKDCGLLRHAIIESDTTYSTGGIDLHYEVRTAWRATGVIAQGGNLFCDSLLSTYLTAATFLREMVPGIDTCPVPSLGGHLLLVTFQRFALERKSTVGSYRGGSNRTFGNILQRIVADFCFKPDVARSRWYRRRSQRSTTRWKTLDEIYNLHQ